MHSVCMAACATICEDVYVFVLDLRRNKFDYAVAKSEFISKYIIKYNDINRYVNARSIPKKVHDLNLNWSSRKRRAPSLLLRREASEQLTQKDSKSSQSHTNIHAAFNWILCVRYRSLHSSLALAHCHLLWLVFYSSNSAFHSIALIVFLGCTRHTDGPMHA